MNVCIKYSIKSLIYVFFTLINVQSHGQIVLHDALVLSGSLSQTEPEGQNYQLVQSIGQKGPIGTFTNNGIQLRQGFLLPLHSGARTSPSFDKMNLDAVLYPNPCQNTFQLEFLEELKGNCLVQIYDKRGVQIQKHLLTEDTSITTFFVDDLAPGAYFIKVETRYKSFQTELIKLQ